MPSWPEKRTQIGTRHTRIDGPLKVTGAAKYPSDVQPEGWLYGMILRSKWAKAKITKINLDPALKIPGINMGDDFTSGSPGFEIRFPFDPGNKYTVPYGWGMTALAHNTTYTQDDPRIGSWALLFEGGPQRYSGKLGFTDEREEVMAAALQYLGYSANSHSKDELRQAGELLLRVKPHIKAFYPGAEAKKALITEDIVVALSWSGETVKAHAQNPAVVWSLPKEGGTGWFDGMAIPKAAPHKFTAAVFINYMLRPDVAAANANTTGYATANRVAIEQYVVPQVANNPAIYPPADALARVTFLETIPDDLLPFYEDIWTRVLGV